MPQRYNLVSNEVLLRAGSGMSAESESESDSIELISMRNLALSLCEYCVDMAAEAESSVSSMVVLPDHLKDY